MAPCAPALPCGPVDPVPVVAMMLPLVDAKNVTVNALTDACVTESGISMAPLPSITSTTG
jgi:hypothetical protein